MINFPTWVEDPTPCTSRTFSMVDRSWDGKPCADKWEMTLKNGRLHTLRMNGNVVKVIN